MNFYGNTANYGGGITTLASTTGLMTITSSSHITASVGGNFFFDIGGTSNYYIRNSGAYAVAVRATGQTVFGAINSTAPTTSRVVVETGDVELKAVGAGIIVNDAANNGKRWRISVNNGTITATQL